MKKFVTFLFFSFIISSFSLTITAQGNLENVALTKTNAVEKTDIPELHLRAWDWAQNYFNDEQHKITNKDMDEDKIILNVDVVPNTQGNVTFNLVIDLKDSEYTYTISEVNSQLTSVETDNYLDEVGKRIERAMITGFTPAAREQMNK